jgi:hypothetical protein
MKSKTRMKKDRIVKNKGGFILMKTADKPPLSPQSIIDIWY